MYDFDPEALDVDCPDVSDGQPHFFTSDGASCLRSVWYSRSFIGACSPLSGAASHSNFDTFGELLLQPSFRLAGAFGALNSYFFQSVQSDHPPLTVKPLTLNATYSIGFDGLKLLNVTVTVFDVAVADMVGALMSGLLSPSLYFHWSCCSV